MARVIWNPLASADLTEIAEYISGDSHEQARSVVRQILETVERASEMPELGSIVPEYNRRDIRERSSCGFRIVYRLLDEDTIEAVMIRRQTRQLPRTVE